MTVDLGVGFISANLGFEYNLMAVIAINFMPDLNLIKLVKILSVYFIFHLLNAERNTV